MENYLLNFFNRIIEGIGSSISIAAYSTIFIKLYPDKVGSVTSWSGTALGVGYSVGPILGGFLYDIGGFHLPFVTIGVANLLFAFATLVALLPVDCMKSETTKECDEVISTTKILLKVITIHQSYSKIVCQFCESTEPYNTYTLC